MLASVLACVLGTGCASGGHIGVAQYCDEPAPLSAAQHDRLIRFGGIIRGELERSGASVALVSRSGLDLSRFGQRYSHAGVSLKAGPEVPWAVRQLYFACEERRPRLFDQGLPAFVLGGDEPALGYVSVVLLPQQPAAALERAALHNQRALEFLGAQYSANAYPFSVRYQNCNQWVAELLAAAWSPGNDTSDTSDTSDTVDNGDNGDVGGTVGGRQQAQDWLRSEGYEPTVFDVGWRVLMWAGAFIPWLHSGDHPAEDIQQKIYRVSMPASIEAFVRRKFPDATRLEFCHTETQVVIRRGWAPLADGCQAEPHDTVIALQ